MNEKIVAILYKRITGSIITYEEELQLEGWIAQSQTNRVLNDELTSASWLRSEIQVMLGYDSKALWKKISAQLPSKKFKDIPLYKKLLQYIKNKN